MMVTVSLELHRALEKKYSQVVADIEWLMRNPLKSCEMCEKAERCGKSPVDCVPVWKGRKEI